MSTAPVARSAVCGSTPAPDAGDGLRREVCALRDRYARAWLATPTEPPGPEELGPSLSRWRQWRNRRRSDRLVRRVCRRLPRIPEPGPARATWKAALKDEICAFGETCLGWPPSWRESPLAEELFEGSVDFVRRARALGERFEIDLRRDHLFQALRNVWILNGLQILLGRPVQTTPSVFAYSMLYPLTDNFLDDPEVPSEAKAGFNRRLGRRLAGAPSTGGAAARDRRERAVFELVGAIEGEFPRARHPRVFASLQAIHRAQVESLRQQRGSAPDDDAADLLRLSCEKGGTSVLADGFLVAGELAPEEAEFLFGYGVALQLLDDLQDATEDRANGHRTLFSIAAGRTPLDALTSRLARFTARVLGATDRFEAPEWPVIAGLMRGNCPLLLLQAVADQQSLFRPSYVRRMERHFPVRYGALPRLERRARRRWARTEAALRRARERGAAAGTRPLDF